MVAVSKFSTLEERFSRLKQSTEVDFKAPVKRRTHSVSKVDGVLYVHIAWDRIQVRQSPSDTVPMDCQVDTPIKAHGQQAKPGAREVKERVEKKLKLKFMTHPDREGPFLMR
ncbi:unnamed protein product [Aspergillus oryzae var. brunneus]|uniref:Unnamed protein product n=1 Tax=Aspergillus oryzae var. brunneus TaxID=332754 RepID=A0ABQ6KNH4_ASPOZ|nr:unnamed protein product [Aspergillus oryzae]GMG46528.1 unnamed protein product [Aspergillus oryzae var. brunneus]